MVLVVADVMQAALMAVRVAVAWAVAACAVAWAMAEAEAELTAVTAMRKAALRAGGRG